MYVVFIVFVVKECFYILDFVDNNSSSWFFKRLGNFYGGKSRWLESSWNFVGFRGFVLVDFCKMFFFLIFIVNCIFGWIFGMRVFRIFIEEVFWINCSECGVWLSRVDLDWILSGYFLCWGCNVDRLRDRVIFWIVYGRVECFGLVKYCF